jgi:hypothetical protein
METEITQANFAKFVGVSKAAISKAIKRGMLELNENRKIDLENRKTKIYVQSRADKNSAAQKKAETDAKVGQAVAIEKLKNSRKDELRDQENAESLGNYAGGSVPGAEQTRTKDLRFMEKLELDEEEKRLKIQKLEISNAKDRADLIDRNFVERFVSVLYSIDVNEFMQFSAKLTPRICQGIFKCDDPEKMMAVNKLLDDEGWKTLQHIQRRVNDFLEEMGSEKQVGDEVETDE